MTWFFNNYIYLKCLDGQRKYRNQCLPQRSPRGRSEINALQTLILESKKHYSFHEVFSQSTALAECDLPYGNKKGVHLHLFCHLLITSISCYIKLKHIKWKIHSTNGVSLGLVFLFIWPIADEDGNLWEACL